MGEPAAETATRGAPLIRIEHVSLEFQGRPVLKDVNAHVDDVVSTGHTRGQVVGFLGPSGIGKTQLCRILAGLLVPTTGRVLVGLEGLPVQPGMVGLVAQNYVLFNHRTVWGNLLTAAKRSVEPNPGARALSMLERFRLLDHAQHYPQQLSGGQRQRVAIAQQLLCSEHFLLMDEPFSGLDPIMGDEVARLVREVADAHELNTIVVVTHDVSAAVAVSDTLWMMGRDTDQAGHQIPGARIKAVYDLIERGLAWHDDVRMLPAFAETVREVRARFLQL